GSKTTKTLGTTGLLIAGVVLAWMQFLKSEIY
ncbi:MAG: hypothetical protein XD43_1241, partial [Thermococcales archaeon 44_46]